MFVFSPKTLCRMKTKRKKKKLKHAYQRLLLKQFWNKALSEHR
jgi:hypothetical protein